MIGAFVCGGLGNQMFQYAAARALALRRGTGVQLDLAAYGKAGEFEIARPFELGKLAIAVEPGGIGAPLAFLLARRQHKALQRLSGWTIRREQSLAFDPAINDLGNRTYLFGYWQSWRYFDDHATQIRAELQPRAELSAASRRTLDEIHAANSLALHVRRGDYVSSAQVAEFFGSLATDYYRAGVRHVTERASGIRGFVFSDDLDWCREALRDIGIPLTFVDANRGADSWQDLYLMAACRHAIMANSSFSWWAAWLGDGAAQADRVVIAPRKWFAATDVPVQDRCPPGWLTL